jgi:uncharacterized protein (TIGR03000 family)
MAMKNLWLALAAVGALAVGPALVRGQSVRYAYENPPPVYPAATHSPYIYAGYGTLYAPGYSGGTNASYRSTMPSSLAAASYNYVAFFPLAHPGDSPAAAPAPPPTDTSVAGRRAVVQVEVPADATVWFNGTQTKQGGTMRTYQTPALESGYPYYYDVKARWEANGKPVEQTRRIEVYPGGRVTVAFTRPGL